MCVLFVLFFSLSSGALLQKNHLFFFFFLAVGDLLVLH